MSAVIPVFKDLLGINSVSRKEKAAAVRIIEYFSSLKGWRVSVDESSPFTGSDTGNVICVKKGSACKPAMVFSAHMDTISSTENINIVDECGKIKTDGATILGADDKAGIAALIAAAQQLPDNDNLPDVIYIFTVCEEIGLLGSKNVDLNLLGRPLDECRCFVLDSTDSAGTLITQGPYANRFNLAVRGKAAHAGIEPEKGINAIRVLAEIIAGLPLGRVDDTSTMNVGSISGGGATNIIPAFAEAKGEARSFSKDSLDLIVKNLKSMARKAAAVKGAEAECDVRDDYDGFNIHDKNIVSIFEKACLLSGVKFRQSRSCGGSDANVYNKRGLVSVNMGLGIEGAHSARESISESSLEAVFSIVMHLIAGHT